MNYNNKTERRITMNETIKNILERRSIRKYQEKQVEKSLLEEVAKVGTYAP